MYVTVSVGSTVLLSEDGGTVMPPLQSLCAGLANALQPTSDIMMFSIIQERVVCPPSNTIEGVAVNFVILGAGAATVTVTLSETEPPGPEQFAI